MREIPVHISGNLLKSFSRHFFLLFWGLNSLEGLFSFYWFMQLPLSESDKAVFLGYSPTRLAVLFVFGAVVGGCIIMFIRSFMDPEWSLRTQTALRSWMERHDFFVTGLLTCLAAWGLLGIALEILLNPAWFPRSLLYHFLYIRVRPIFLWTALVSIQGFMMIASGGWYRLQENGHKVHQSSSLAGWGAAVLIAGNFTLWIVKTVYPALFVDQNGLILAMILLLVVFNFGLVAVIHYRRE